MNLFMNMSGALFECVFKIEPYPKRTGKVVTRGKFPHIVKNENTRLFEASITQMAKSLYKGELLKCALRVEIKFFLTKPESCKKREYPFVKPDLDNLLKSFLDGCNGVIWEDDSTICSIHASKEYSTSQGFIILKVFPM